MSDVPKGYRMSEVGVIPEEWEVKTLGELSKIVRGGSPRPAGDPKYFNGNYIPWLTVAALTKIPKSLVYVSQTMDFLTEAGSKKSRTLESGTLILSNSGATLGVCKILSIKCCANDGIAALLDFNKNIDKFYVCYYLNTKTKQFREVVATGNGQPNLNTTLIGLTQIPLPPLPEQQAIASALSDVDALITALEQFITKKRNIKQGAMQQLLTGEKRLPGFGGEWEVRKIKQLGEVITGGTPPTHIKEFWNGTIPWVTPTDISNKKDICQTEREITSFGLSSIRRLPKNSVLVTCIASIGKNSILRIDGACNQQINAIVSNVENDADFIYYLMENKKSFLLSNAGKTATNIISKKDFSEMYFSTPKISEQQAIAQILSDMDTEIEALEQKRDKYKTIKQGMMQELLTGKTRFV